MLKLGEKIISDIYLGDKKIAKVFWGDKLVYQAGKPIFLDYVESTGGRIDTDFKPNQDTTVNITWAESSEINYGTAFFGTRDDATPTNAFIFWGAGAGYWRDQYGNQNFVSTIKRDTEKHTLVKDKNKTYLDGVLLKEHTYTEFSCSHNMYLFCVNEGGQGSYHGSVKIYSCIIYDNDVLVRDLRPCIHPNGTVCFYDMITKKYFYNQGTGTLTAGNKIKFVDYILSDIGVWIVTDISPSNTQKWVLDCKINKPSDTGFNLMGINTNKRCSIVTYGSTSKIGTIINGTTNLQTIYKDVYRHVYTLDLPNHIFNIDGIDYAIEGTIDLADNPSKILLCNDIDNGNTSFRGYVYACQIYDNNILIRDFKPCVVAGEACFYDMVTGNLFTNAGTGTLTYTE